MTMGDKRWWFVALLWAGCADPVGQPLSRCSVDGECPLHQYCERAESRCRSGCFLSSECGESDVCNDHGRCVPPQPADFGRAPFDLSGADLTESPSDLSTPPGCGNGTVEAGETCDDGLANSDSPTVAATCTTHCRRRARCGTLAGSLQARIDPDSGHCYVAWAGPENHANAERQCEGRGGSLVSINSAAEDAIVRGLAPSGMRWIGLVSRRPGASDLRWLSGEARTFNAWAPGEPSNSGNAEDCAQLDPVAGGWNDITCGWATSGGLGPSGPATAPYVCESGCGNGAVEPGEECDPPGGVCTSRCMTRRACTEPGGVVAEANGHCYFQTAATGQWNMGACPAGTRLARLTSPNETAAALMAITQDAWIALRGETNANVFTWRAGSPDFNPRIYHGFGGSEPNHGAVPVCVRMTTIGWRDAACGDTYAYLCERE